MLGTTLTGQIDITQYEEDFGEGEITLKKRISISFVYSESDKTYHAKVTHRYDKLYIGGSYANGLIQVPFNLYQDLKLQKARYFKLEEDGEKILLENVKVKYADTKDYFIKNIFYSDLKVKQFKCSVDLPKDYFVSYQYEEIIKDLKFLTSFYFQNASEAVEDVEIVIKKNANVEFSLYDFNLDKIEKVEDETSIKYIGKNLKRYFASNKSVKGSYYLPHFIVSTNSIKINGKNKEILKSTDNLYAWYNSLIKELSPDDEYIDKLAKSIVGNSSKQEEKIDKIFKWVQNNIQYVAFEDGIAGFKPTESHEVAASKFGDCKGMANLLVNLLQSQGFDAMHAWIGTRSNNYSYDIPSLVVDNHMICGLNLNNATYFLDGTSKSAMWNIAPPHLEGKEVMMANKETYQIVRISKSKPEKNKINISGNIDMISDRPKIELKVELTGHFKRDFVSYEAYSPLKKKKNVPFYFLSQYLDGVKIENISDPIMSKEKITFTLSGSYMNIARGNTTTVFPFLDILEFDEVNEDMPPYYVDFPQTIISRLEIVNSNKSPKEQYSSTKIGNESFSAVYSSENVGGKTIIHQKMHLDILHTPTELQNEWNSFTSQIKAFKYSPLSYE